MAKPILQEPLTRGPSCRTVALRKKKSTNFAIPRRSLFSSEISVNDHVLKGSNSTRRVDNNNKHQIATISTDILENKQ